MGGTTLCFAQGGKVIASCDTEGTVRLLNVVTGKAICEVRTHEYTCDLAATPDGNCIVTAHPHDDTVRLWQLPAGKEVRHWTAKACTLAISPDGKILATSGGYDVPIRLWTVGSGEEIRHFGEHQASLNCLAFSRDGRVLATGGDDTLIHLWDVASGKELRPYRAHEGPVWFVSFVPGTNRLLTASQDGTIRTWCAATGAPICELCRELTARQYGAWPANLSSPPALPADGRLIAWEGADHAVHLGEVETGRHTARLVAPEDPGDSITLALALSPDGKMVACGRYDATVVLWEVASGRAVHTLTGHDGWVGAVAYSPDGKMLASAGEGEVGVRIWESATGNLLNKLPVRIDTDYGISAGALAFFPDSQTVAVTTHNGTLGLWQARTGHKLATLSGLQSAGGPLAVSSDGRLLASTGVDWSVRVWEVLTHREICRLDGHRNRICSLAFSPDCRMLASGSEDTTALVWSLPAAVGQRAAKPGTLGRGALEKEWAALGGGDASRAHAALWTLVASPEQAVPWIAQNLRPVRTPERARMAAVITDLDSERFTTRAKAASVLSKWGELAEPALRKAMAANPSPEVRRRIQQLLRSLEGPEMPAQRLRLLRAIFVLEQVATPQARQALRALATGAPAARVTREAMVSLARLDKRRHSGRR
jgi:WD40 repeat protein